MGASELPSLHEKSASWVQMGFLGLSFKTRLCETPLGRSRPFLWRGWSSASKTVPEPHETCWELGVQNCFGHIPPSSHVLGHASWRASWHPKGTQADSGTTLDNQMMRPITGCSQRLLGISVHFFIKKKKKMSVQCLELKGWLLNNLFIFGYTGFLFCTQAFSSCGKEWLFSSCGVKASHFSGFSCFRAQALGIWASVVVALRP